LPGVKKENPEEPGIYIPGTEEAGTPPPAEKANEARVPPKPPPEPVNLDSMIDTFLSRPPGLTWPWRELAKLNEIDIGSITTIIAGTSHGKTSVAISLALYFLSQGKRVLFWSGEMPPEMLTIKILGLQTETSLKTIVKELHNYKDGNPVSAEVYHAIPVVAGYCKNLFIPAAWEMRECHQVLGFADEVKPDIVMIDYIQQLRPGDNKYRTRDEEIEAVMDDLNLYAIANSIPIINFAQINREAKNTEKPNLTCIRHSATIEQYSANVIGIWNAAMARYEGTTPIVPAEGYYWYDDNKATGEAVAVAENENRNLMELIILKSRYHGNVGKSVPLFFDGAIGSIKDYPEHTYATVGKVVEL